MKLKKYPTRCLKCQKIFKSPDPVRRRICPICEEENRKEPKEYHVIPPSSGH